MDTQIIFGDSPRQYQLTRAILVYESQDRRDCAASVHEVARHHGRPVIAPGQPVTLAALEQLIAGLGRNVGSDFIPPQILSVGLDKVAWWCPAQRRRIWFKPDKRFDATPDEAIQRLIKLNGQFIYYPPLLFVAAHSLKVYALAVNQRPVPATPIYKAPFWNLTGGDMCNGNLTLPASHPDHLDGFEKAFFDSAFTHNSGGGQLCVHPGGYCGLLEDLIHFQPDETYWSAHLLRTNDTAASVIKSS
jgi:PRTRC genetic system protein B